MAKGVNVLILINNLKGNTDEDKGKPNMGSTVGKNISIILETGMIEEAGIHRRVVKAKVLRRTNIERYMKRKGNKQGGNKKK